LSVAAVAAACAIAWPASAQDVTHLIVKFKDVPAKISLPTAERLAHLSADHAIALRPLREMALGAHVVALDAPLSREDAERVASRLRASADVEYVEPDLPRHVAKSANDEFRFAQSGRGQRATGPGMFNALTRSQTGSACRISPGD